jgi:tetratricopeptide (TPR) repeat protein
LLKYPHALEENSSSILLLARAQKAMDKPEAVDSYAKWLTVAMGTASLQGLYEYAQVLEAAGFYARALEQYKDAIGALAGDTGDLKKSTLMYEEARLLMIADPENAEGIMALGNSVREGFSDTAALEELLRDARISQASKDEIQAILNNMLNKDIIEESSEP